MEILLLHGALSDSTQLIPLQRELQRDATVQMVNFPSHGQGKKEPFLMRGLVSWLKDFVASRYAGEVNIFGYSMGGYAALAMASEYDINKVVTLGTKLEWTPGFAQKEIKMLNPEAIMQKVPAFAASLKKMHGEDWQNLLTFTGDMMLDLGDKPVLNAGTFKRISANVMLMRGEGDHMVSGKETEDAAALIPSAHMVTLPGVPHALEKADPVMLASKVFEFFSR